MSDLAVLILGIAGAALSLLFSYVPTLKVWFDKQANKGLLMLGFCVVVGAVYFGLSCSPLAAQLKISLTCDQPGLFNLAQALFVIAGSNQLAYKFSNNAPSAKV